MKPNRTRVALLILVFAVAAPLTLGCAAAIPADPSAVSAPATAFDVQAGAASDAAGEFVATLLAGVVVGLFLAGVGAAYSAWTD